jgi:hypothetical protein
MPHHASGSSVPTPLSFLHERIIAAAPYSTLERITPQRASELRDAFDVHHQQLQFLPRRICRGLQRKWNQPLAGLALLLTLGAARR